MALVAGIDLLGRISQLEYPEFFTTLIIDLWMLNN